MTNHEYDSSDDDTQYYISDGEQSAQWEQHTTSAMSPAIVGTYRCRKYAKCAIRTRLNASALVRHLEDVIVPVWRPQRRRRSGGAQLRACWA